MKKILQEFYWTFHKSKFSIPFLIIIIIICSLNSVISVFTAFVTKYIIDSASINNINKAIISIIILGILFLTRIILNTVDTVFSSYCFENIKNKLQRELYNHIIHSNFNDYNRYHSMEFLTRLTNDINTISNMIIYTIPNIVSLSVMFISSFFAVFSLSPFMSAISISVFPFLILLSKIYGKKLKYFYLELQKKETEYNSFLQESFINIIIIKSFCLEKIKLKNLDKIQKDKIHLVVKRNYFNCISNGLFSLSSFLGYFMVFIWGTFNIASGIEQNFGSLTAMLQLFTNIQQPVYGLSSAFPQLISALAASERIMEMDSLTQEYNPYILKNSDNTNDLSSYTLSFYNVNFSYNKHQHILNNVSFTVHSGEIIGLIGASGEGKTTIINLILSLISPDSGSILINSEPLNINHRNLISYVPQGNTLFSGTILDNLKIAKPDAHMNEISKALKCAYAFDFVNSLKENINTVIGEKGDALSGGQVQRIAIARAFLKKSPILLLDEATSSIDMETELKILDSIRHLDYNPICIFITHRPAALFICDTVFKLENGNLTKTDYCS